MDCHVESYIERSWRKHTGCWRAVVIHTDSGRVLYTTWPYAHEAKALDAARDWMAMEYLKAQSSCPLFTAEVAENAEKNP